MMSTVYRTAAGSEIFMKQIGHGRDRRIQSPLICLAEKGYVDTKEKHGARHTVNCWCGIHAFERGGPFYGGKASVPLKANGLQAYLPGELSSA